MAIRPMKKRGIFFTVDGIFASILMVMGLVIIFSQFIENDQSEMQTNYLSSDIINCLANIRISEVNDTFIQSLITSGNITNPNNTLIEQIGEFYVLNQTALAYYISNYTSDMLIPARYGFEILVNDESVMTKAGGPAHVLDLVSYRRMVSGFEKFKPMKGSTSKVYLEGINEKMFSSYLYYGGFIGQGNITSSMNDIPADANFTDMYLEAEAGGSFNLKINNNQCGGTYSPSAGTMSADIWNITSCMDYLNPGYENNFTLFFPGPINNSFMAGGYIKVNYKTKQFTVYSEEKTIRYHFPGINGVTNLYDAFFVPGTIESMNVFLHFTANETSYLTLGSRIIHDWPGNTTDQRHNITNAMLSTPEYNTLSDDFDIMSNNTIPIRFRSYKDSFQLVNSTNADVILITDLSGSMKNAVSNWRQGNNGGSCSAVFADPDIRRTLAARCLDTDLINNVMASYGNRIWPVCINNNAINAYSDDPLNKANVADYVNNPSKCGTQNGEGSTCIACSINKAYDLLKLYSNNSRKKFIILMSDGCPTHCAQGSCTSNSSVFGAQQCAGLCDKNNGAGSCSNVANPPQLPGLCSDCTTNQGATDNSYYSARRAQEDLNVTIFTVGFGPMNDCALASETLQNISRIGNGSYQYSRNISELQLIYDNISKEILTRVEQSMQTVNVMGGELSRSILYPDSYIDIQYIPIAEKPNFDEISLSFQTGMFPTASSSFDIPSGVRVTDARMVSYSGPHWTDGLVVNGNQIYNLSTYMLDYVNIGDPFFVYIPVNKLVPGTNTIYFRTGDSPDNSTGISLNNSVIYTGLIKSSVSYSDVLERAVGCKWYIEFDDGGSINLSVPPGYNGTKTCYYSTVYADPAINWTGAYDRDDTYDDAMFRLLYNLDYDQNGQIFLNLKLNNFRVDAISVGKIPYPWGPAITEARVWK